MRSLYAAVLASGVSGLTWEMLWQQRTGLALGVSAWATTLTLAAMMAGMGAGALLAARLARRGRLRRPLFAYGLAEAAVGLGGLCVPWGLAGLERLDAWLWPLAPGGALAVQAVGTLLVLLPPSVAMGATLPILAAHVAGEERGQEACATGRRSRIATLYAINVSGAVVGVLAATFAGLPVLGVADTERIAAALNLAVALWAVTRPDAAGVAPVVPASARPPAPALMLAFTSGFTVFVLEVSWFRSLRAAFQSTTESFAIILAAFLTALALGAWLAPRVRRHLPGALELLLPLAALAVLVATPLVDAPERWLRTALDPDWSPAALSLRGGVLRFAALFAVLAVPVTLLGTLLPWLLSDHESAEGVGHLTLVNTVGSVSGALLAGFVLLPTLGATRTSWVAGLCVLAAGVAALPSPRGFARAAAAGALGLVVAIPLSGGAARLRVQGYGARQAFDGVLYVAEGPDSTVQVTRALRSDDHILVIDGFAASQEGPGSEYMQWMGHLPALAASRLDDALVIGFGTGQTTQAVRLHHPRRLFVADVSAAVFGAADLFPSNGGVLDDPSVHPVVMDGRAFLRRSGDQRFDLVTLEPMPPNFAGVNNLYSREFYQLVADHLAPGGVVAQWVPFHLIAPEHMLAIVATFQDVFPETRLWITPQHGTGILVGGKQPWELHASAVPLPPHEGPLSASFRLGVEQVAELSRGAPLITDNNQLLAFGFARFARAAGYGRNWYHAMHQQNLWILDRLSQPQRMGMRQPDAAAEGASARDVSVPRSS